MNLKISSKRDNFFRLPPPSASNPVSVKYPLGIFSLYLLAIYIAFPLFLVFVSVFTTGHLFDPTLLRRWNGWLQIGALSVLFFLFIGFCFLIKPQVRHFVFWGEEPRSRTRFWQAIRAGVLGWVVSYPFVLLVSVVTGWIALKLWGVSKVEQVAVHEIKTLFGHPLALTLMIVVVVILVPFMEELLFRGFLQNWLKRWCSRGWAIVITALLFSVVHFSPSQGYGNFQLILSLGVLALFLGFIYEKNRSLWAPIALHFAFNACSVLVILLSH